MQFEGRGKVFESLLRITRRLDDLEIPYALVGGMALFFHGFQRTTDDVDILVTREGLAKIHEKLKGLGYVPPFVGSKHLRDVESGVKVEFLVQGGYPGDGLPKPISFPNPSDVFEIIDGVRCLQLPKLVELKLASGTAPGRRKDLGDVQELIRILQLPLALREQLDPSVRDMYSELWRELHPGESDVAVGQH